MNRRRVAYVMLLGASLLPVVGCKDLLKKRDPEAAPSAAPVAVAPTVVAPLPTTPPLPEAPPVAAVDETAVPTTEDFEDEAFQKVTAANFRAQLTQLKLDIAKR